MTTDEAQERVRSRYAAAAIAVFQDQGCGCGDSDCCSDESGSCCTTADALNQTEAFGAGLYTSHEQEELPEEALLASLGCGNPVAVADLRSGEVVLDLGSGGGIDVLLSARRVGSDGFAYGVDMTDQMLELACTNAAKAGATNVEFLKGTIEDLPLPDASVDVVISNCVINLSGDKTRVCPRRSGSSGPAAASGSPMSSPRTSSPPPIEPSGAPSPVASPARGRGRSTWTGLRRPASATRPYDSPTKPHRKCTRPSSVPPNPRLPLREDISDQSGYGGGGRHRLPRYRRDRLRYCRATAVPR